MEKKKILIIMGRYLPGYKDGGPVRSIKNLVDYLGDEYKFQILTCDRDHGDVEAYDNIKVNDWNQVGKADVYYVEPKGFRKSVLKKLAMSVDVVYICGCFNDYAINTLILKRLNKIKVPVVVASMGLFSPLEFRLKYKKKKLFVMTFNILGLFKKIKWSATSAVEILEIKKQVWAKDEQFYIAEDLPRLVEARGFDKEKKKDSLEVVWVSRITEKKNLLKAIEILSDVKLEVKLTIYGPIHTAEYWEKCKKELDNLPKNIRYEYKGNIESERMVETLSKYQVFLFPTLGENYGHVIQEALSAGCPCILSDQTPWRNLEEQGVGFVHSLGEHELFVKSIEYYAHISTMEWDVIVNKVLEYAIRNSNEKVGDTGYRDIFNLEK